ncbi:MAG: VWA domain-containing protein, partial [Lewinella sp.]|nr:VWA domain-containing protein [Lewinella sp.]
MRTLLIFFLAAFLVNLHPAMGQCIDIDECTDRTYVQHIELSQPIPSGAPGEILIRWSGVTGITWSACVGSTEPGGPCDDPSDFRQVGGSAGDFTFGAGDNLRLSPVGSNRLRLSGTPSAAEELLVNIHAEAPGETPQDKQYRLIIRRPLHLVFMLDKSGSMSGTPTNALANKWDMAYDALAGFSEGMDADSLSLLSGDRLCLIAFNQDEIVPAKIGTFVEVDTFQKYLGTIVGPGGSLSPQGSTSIGDGLRTAVYDRQGGAVSTNFRQVNVLISDGLQNEMIMVDPAGDKLVMPAPNGLFNRAGAGGYMATYAIGFDDDASNPGTDEQLLKSIASESTSDFYFHTRGLNDDNYSPYFTELFSRVFNRFSPQFVDSRWVSVPLVTNVEPRLESSFRIQDDVQSLFFQVSFPKYRANRFRYELRRDGVLINPEHYRLYIGQYSTTLSLNFQALPDLRSRGLWTLTAIAQGSADDVGAAFMVNPPSAVATNDVLVVGSKKMTYLEGTMLAMVDEHYVDAEYSITNDPTIQAAGGNVQVGTRLRPQVRLLVRGRPVSGATITASLQEPGADKGTVVGNARVDFSAGQGVNPYVAKYEAILAQNPALLQQLAMDEHTIVLDDLGDGQYAGHFNKLKVADNVAVIFRITYQDSLLGTIERYYRACAASRFGELDHNLSAISVDPPTEGSTYTLVYKPTYWNGSRAQLVGPGYADVFSVENGDLLSVDDQGDGTYILHI